MNNFKKKLVTLNYEAHRHFYLLCRKLGKYGKPLFEWVVADPPYWYSEFHFEGIEDG